MKVPLFGKKSSDQQNKQQEDTLVTSEGISMLYDLKELDDQINTLQSKIKELDSKNEEKMQKQYQTTAQNICNEFLELCQSGVVQSLEQAVATIVQMNVKASLRYKTMQLETNDRYMDAIFREDMAKNPKHYQQFQVLNYNNQTSKKQNNKW